jgi:VIT1/CCC1 family predicted Fe2+/Mn2+ transporter
VLGANDGLLSTASLVVGVAAASAVRGDVLIAGIAGLVAGAGSMAAGEYVSVSSQADTERADLQKEQQELNDNWEGELQELTTIYTERGLDSTLARQVAEQLMAHNALEAHARDELGISENFAARPFQAALASAVSFMAGALMPLLVVLIVPESSIVVSVAAVSLLCLIALGAVAAYSGGASMVKGAIRVTFWGAIAMGLTALIGSLFGTVV